MWLLFLQTCFLAPPRVLGLQSPGSEAPRVVLWVLRPCPALLSGAFLLRRLHVHGSVFPAVCLSCLYVHPAVFNSDLRVSPSLSSWCVFSCEFLNTSVMVALKSLCSDSVLCIILGLFLLTNFLPGYGHIFLLPHMSNDFLLSARHHKFSACLDLVVFP